MKGMIMENGDVSELINFNHETEYWRDQLKRVRNFILLIFCIQIFGLLFSLIIINLNPRFGISREICILIGLWIIFLGLIMLWALRSFVESKVSNSPQL